MSKFGRELIESMKQAARHASGRKVAGVREPAVKHPDAKAFFSERRERADFAAFDRLMRRKGGEKPGAGDEVD